MKKTTVAILLATHLAFGAAGFAVGIYALPILIAPPAPTESEVTEKSSRSVYSGNFVRELADSDRFHWGEGEVSVGEQHITFMGDLAPGPDYKLYLSPQFVETEAEFERLKSSMVRVGDVKTFDNFIVELDSDIEITKFNTVIVWCETFGEFITAAQYR